MISGRYDPTFWYEFTEEMFRTCGGREFDWKR